MEGILSDVAAGVRLASGNEDERMRVFYCTWTSTNCSMKI